MRTDYVRIAILCHIAGFVCVWDRTSTKKGGVVNGSSFPFHSKIRFFSLENLHIQNIFHTFAPTKKKDMETKELKRLEQKVYDYESKLNGALSDLANAATQVLGYEVIADLCSGGSEIEFRTVSDDGMPDSDSCIRMENVMAKIKMEEK